MCLNYNNNTCIATRRACILGEKGKDAKKGECKLHGESYVFVAQDNKVILTNYEPEKEKVKEMLAYHIEFLLADEMASKKAVKMSTEVNYELKK